jgi:DNA-binding MarR family transcriptional regulator
MRVLTERVERETRLAAPSFFVLAWLLRSGNQAVPLSMLARQVAFSSGGFTKMADRLEQAGLIERQPCPDDRRVTNAVLTPAGRAHAEQAVAVYCAGLRDLVLRHVGPDGLRTMAGQMSLLSGGPAPAGWPADQGAEGSGPARLAGSGPARSAGAGLSRFQAAATSAAVGGSLPCRSQFTDATRMASSRAPDSSSCGHRASSPGVCRSRLIRASISPAVNESPAPTVSATATSRAGRAGRRTDQPWAVNASAPSDELVMTTALAPSRSHARATWPGDWPG